MGAFICVHFIRRFTIKNDITHDTGNPQGAFLCMTSILTQHYIVLFVVVSDRDRIQKDIFTIRPD